MTSNTIARIEADLEQFISGADPTLDVENIRDLIAEHHALRAENERLKRDHHSACVRNDAFVLEIERLRDERDNALAAQKIVLLEIGTEIERLRADNQRLAECWDTEMAAHRNTEADTKRLRAALQGIIDRASSEGRPVLVRTLRELLVSDKRA